MDLLTFDEIDLGPQAGDFEDCDLFEDCERYEIKRLKSTQEEDLLEEAITISYLPGEALQRQAEPQAEPHMSHKSRKLEIKDHTVLLCSEALSHGLLRVDLLVLRGGPLEDVSVKLSSEVTLSPTLTSAGGTLPCYSVHADNPQGRHHLESVGFRLGPDLNGSMWQVQLDDAWESRPKLEEEPRPRLDDPTYDAERDGKNVKLAGGAIITAELVQKGEKWVSNPRPAGTGFNETHKLKRWIEVDKEMVKFFLELVPTGDGYPSTFKAEEGSPKRVFKAMHNILLGHQRFGTRGKMTKKPSDCNKFFSIRRTRS